MDGNYSLHKKSKGDDPEDTALCEDQGVFVPESEVKRHMEQAKQEKKKNKKKKGKGKGKGKTKGKTTVEDYVDTDDSDREDDPVCTLFRVRAC